MGEWKTLCEKEKVQDTSIFSFLAPLAEGQRGIVKTLVNGTIIMAMCPSCVRLSVPYVRACVGKLFLLKTSPQKLSTGFLPNFTGMFLRWPFQIPLNNCVP